MMKYLMLLNFFFCSFAIAQTYKWVDLVSPDYQFNPAILHSPVAIDNSGNPLCARLVNFRQIYGSTAYGDIKLEKRSASGSSIWDNTIFGNVDVSELVVDGENNTICIGTYRDSLVIGTTTLIQTDPNQNSFILKTDISGNFLWVKDAIEFSPEFSVITALTVDASDNILVGVTNYPVISNIYRLDPDGNIVSTIEEADVETISDINVDLSGNIWCTGFAFNGPLSFNGLDTIALFSYNDYIVKYNPSGLALWVSFVEDVTVQEFNIETDNSGNAYLSGNLLLSTHFGNLIANGPQWIYDFFVTKIDPDGNYIWLNEIPPGNSLGDATIGNSNFLSCSNDGDTYLTGYFRGEINFGNGVILQPISNNDIFVISYNQDGNVQWAKAAGGDTYNEGSGIVTDNNGSCYVSGIVSQNGVFDTISVAGEYMNLFLAKLMLDTPVRVENELPDNFPAAENYSLMQNYPNPFNPVTKISYSIPEASFVTLKVFDVLGNEMATLVNTEKLSGGYTVEFISSGLSSGIYFYKLQAGNFVETKKMLLMK